MGSTAAGLHGRRTELLWSKKKKHQDSEEERMTRFDLSKAMPTLARSMNE